MNKRTRFLPGLLVIALALALLINVPGIAKTKGESSKGKRLAKTTVLSSEQFNGNSIASWMQNTGQIVSEHVTGNSGMEWPRGSTRTIDYASGLWLVGKTASGEVRTACTEYATEFQAGPILADGTASDTDDEIYRIYKINRDGTGDWDVWPFDQGAPAVKAADGSDSLDADGNKIPLLIGDQTCYWVMNDLDPAAHSNLFSTNPMGVEEQVLVFGFNTADPLGNIMFVKWTIINKSNTSYDSCFVAVWDDPDLGDASDDLVGCDTTLSLGYCYNGQPTDATYGTTPPAIGFDFFQGPESPKGSRNYLPMTSFVYYWNGAPDPYGDPEDATQMFNFMKGFTNDGTSYLDDEGTPSRFVFNGDPVNGTGWLDSAPDDRRFLMSSGPFTLAAGDTQVIVGAKIIAPGVNNLNAVQALRFFDSYAQTAFDNNFNLPLPPSPVTRANNLDRKVVLVWQDDINRYKQTESYDFKGYSFQGYNVYQGESSTGPWRLIETFDVVDDFGIVFDDVYDSESGMVLSMPVTFGTNSGITRELVIDSDAITGTPLYNYKSYYFAVTSFALNPDVSPKVVESGQIACVAMPAGSPLGELQSQTYADALASLHTAGTSDATLVPIVVEPGEMVSANYQVEIGSETVMVDDSTSTESKYWMLFKDGVQVIDKWVNVAGDEDYPIVDGVKWKLIGLYDAPTDFSGDPEVLPEANADNYDLSSYGIEGWSATALSVDAWGWGTNSVALLQDDIELRFTGEYDVDGVTIKDGTGSIATIIGARNYTLGESPLNPNPGVDEYFTVRIPFEVWNTEKDQQINICIYDRIQAADDSLFYALNPNDRVYCFVVNAPYIEDVVDIGNGVAGPYTEFATWSLVFWEAHWQTGDVIKYKYDNPLMPGEDFYTASTVGYTTDDKTLAKSNIDNVNVVPNPYFAWNPAERIPTSRIIRFTNLPANDVTIRIFDLAGNLVKVIDDNLRADQGSLGTAYAQWDVRNASDIPVSSGMYLAHVQIKGVGSKVLKLAVINRDERLIYY